MVEARRATLFSSRVVGRTRSGAEFCPDQVSESSIDSLLYRESHRLFPDDAFADVFAEIGRASVPPRIVAFDLRWKYAR